MARKRVFSVYDSDARCEYKVTGVKDLAKHLGVSVEDIPRIRLFRYTVGHSMITEVVTKPEQSENKT